jgi:hypothetical protein
MDDGQLNVNLGASGCYSFSAEDDTQKLCLFSPESGVHKYVWDATNDRYCHCVFASLHPHVHVHVMLVNHPFTYNRWVCDEDGHIMIELLTRQLIRLAKGLPEF